MTLDRGLDFIDEWVAPWGGFFFVFLGFVFI